VSDAPETVAEIASGSTSATTMGETDVSAPEPGATTEEPAGEAAQVEADVTGDDNTAVTSSDDTEKQEQEEPAARTAPEPTPSYEPVASEPQREAAAAANSDGINSDGRAINDPRVAPAAVADVKIQTGHPALFSDQVAPAVVPSGRLVPRASNDPRGPASSGATAPSAEPEPEVAAQG
jgi:ribonuclease E